MSQHAIIVSLLSNDLWCEYKKYMFPGKRTSTFYCYKNGNCACKYGYKNIIFLKPDIYYSRCSIKLAAEMGRIDIVKYLNENGIQKPTKESMFEASKHGHLDIVIYLHQNMVEKCSKEVMDVAAYNGHIDVVKFLHQNRKEGCTTNAIDFAAKNGHLNVIKWLYKNRKEGYSPLALDCACMAGNLEVVNWLLKKRKGCVNSGIKFAMQYGHHEVADFLSKCKPTLCDPSIYCITCMKIRKLI